MDAKYAADMVKFIDKIICCSISDEGSDVVGDEAPSALGSETDQEFMLKLERDSNAIATKTQLHSSNHNATCFKYGATDSKQCRFDFPRPRIVQTVITQQGTIDIYRNNVWVNPWCPGLAALTRSNHDINFIPSNVKALVLVRYITNYATKSDCSQYQRVMGAAFVQKAYEEAADQRMAHAPAGTIRVMDIDKFALRALNCLAYDREISGPLVANTLLGLSEYYSPERTIKRVNLRALCRRFSKVIFEIVDEEDVAESFVRFGKSPDIPSGFFDDYQFRGPELETYSFYNYQKTITFVPFTVKINGDIFFAQTHPNKRSKVQRPLQKGLCTLLLALIRPLSTNEDAKDAVLRGHPETDARQNDVGMILLALFVPWNLLPGRFQAYNATLSTFRDLC